MIQNTFLFLDGVSKTKEKMLWGQGIRSWNDFLDTNEIKSISPHKKKEHDSAIEAAKKQLFLDNVSYFAELLPLCEHWRMYNRFKDECCFLDIETTGLDRKRDSLVMVGLFDGTDTKTFVKGINFDPQTVKNEIKKHKILVTFNGAAFDVPFLETKNPGIIPNIPHIDLKTVCARAGYTGGLKHIEKELGIRRQSEIVQGLCGGDAIRLWRMFLASKEEHYLKVLIDYNCEDVINLKTIADRLTKKLEEDIFRKEALSI